MKIKLFTSVWFLLSVNVFADSAITQLDDVLVTVQKREQDLQSIAASVTSISRSELNDADIVDFRSLGELIPGLDIKATKGDRDAEISIRGLGLRSATPNVTPRQV